MHASHESITAGSRDIQDLSGDDDDSSSTSSHEELDEVAAANQTATYSATTAITVTETQETKVTE